MEPIKKYDNNGIDLKNHLHRVGDIINIEGPVLSLFQDERNKDLYLFDWVDSDEITNRWLIFKIPAETLNQFLLNRISYKKMFDYIKENNFYYADIINSDNIEYSINDLEYLPENYIPTKEAFFDKNDAKRLDEIMIIVNKTIFKDGRDNTLRLNRLDLSEYLDKKNRPISYLLNQDIVTIAIPEAMVERKRSDKNLSENFSNQLETQQNVRENNRLPEKEGMDVYLW